MSLEAPKIQLRDNKAEISDVAKAIELFSKETELEHIRPKPDPKRGDESFGLWFRGHSSASHVLVPSILRTSFRENSTYIDEVSLVRHFKAMNCDVVERVASDFDVLVTMQHYLAPTRILDWTENLLIALFFAVRDPQQDEKDGALWILNARRLNRLTSASERSSRVLFQDELDVLARSCLSRVRHRDAWRDYLKELIRENPIDIVERRPKRILDAIQRVQLRGDQINHILGATVDVRRIQIIRNGQPIEAELDPGKSQNYKWYEPELLDIRLRAPVAVYPNRANRRIRAQSGCFTLHGGTFHPEPKDYEATVIYKNLIGLPITLHEIDRCLDGNRIIDWWRIPKKHKAKIRSTLAQIGITDATLFPELDYQCRYLEQRWARTRAPAEPDPVENP